MNAIYFPCKIHTHQWILTVYFFHYVFLFAKISFSLDSVLLLIFWYLPSSPFIRSSPFILFERFASLPFYYASLFIWHSRVSTNSPILIKIRQHYLGIQGRPLIQRHHPWNKGQTSLNSRMPKFQKWKKNLAAFNFKIILYSLKIQGIQLFHWFSYFFEIFKGSLYSETIIF